MAPHSGDDLLLSPYSVASILPRSCFFFCFFSFFVLVMPFWIGSFIAAKGEVLPSLDPAERDALYDVLEAIDGRKDWRTSFPDLCANAPHGINCDLVENEYHIVDVIFGPISDNSASCSGHAKVHVSISKLLKLRSLTFVQCFTNATTSIPSELSDLGATLKRLVFQDNPSLGGIIPPEICNLTSLERLILSRNSLEGNLPDEIGDLTNLLQLDLGNNHLNGSIPSSFDKLQKLLILDLSYNQLVNQIPNELVTLPNLQTLDLSYNRLEGIIPSADHGLEELEFLNLSGNNLTGGLPESIGRMKKLRDLAIIGSLMQSKLPTFWPSLNNLITLRLSDAGFDGYIPQEIGAILNLTVLDLSGNRLRGSVPAELGFLPHLYEMDLSDNYLTGPVPFSPSFVDRLGEKLLVRNNSGLCYGTALQSYSSLELPPCTDSLPRVETSANITLPSSSSRALYDIKGLRIFGLVMIYILL